MKAAFFMEMKLLVGKYKKRKMHHKICGAFFFEECQILTQFLFQVFINSF